MSKKQKKKLRDKKERKNENEKKKKKQKKTISGETRQKGEASAKKGISGFKS